ncbi:MAG: amidohydrolase family protein [Candidatus Methanoplasma sp.]|jgi:cytosine/adenosine deaminase-related metal-dependent hydrolase|nr:amidohydrolase family protein [Candidatus Methanoplasma sp.]
MDVLSGSVLTDDGIIDGYVCIENGIVTAVEEGSPPKPHLAHGLIIPPMVNSHTHCADAGLKIPKGKTIEELVAPPNGLKHVYLRGLDESSLEDNIKAYARTSRMNGIGAFIDFREGGEKGCRILRKAAPEATILGRPVSEEYDEREISAILDVADGIGISGISDMDHGYIEKAADMARERRKIFAIHASERVREDIDFILSLDPAFVVHMTEATDPDLLKCAESEVPVVVCARSNQYFGKVPPVKRMLDCGVDVAIGTDNAMLCGPDMRSEASAFGDALLAQGGSVDDIIGPLLKNGRKILYPHNRICISAGMTADLAVLPCSGGFSMKDILRNKDLVYRYEPKKEESK